MDTDIAALQRELARLQKRSLSIIKLSEQLTAPPPESDDPAGNTHPSPSSLQSDLEHYRQLFKKLHFSYLEQVSKEKFLRAIVGDPPQVVDPSENAALETELAKTKAALKAQKADVDALVSQLETESRALAARHEAIQIQTAQLGELPAEIDALQARITELEQMTRRAEDGSDDEDGPGAKDARMKMPLAATYEALDAQRAEIRDIDAQITALRRTLPTKAKHIDQLESDLKPLEKQRTEAAQSAEEARARKERRDGGLEDQIELKARWYQGAADVVRELTGKDAPANGV